MNEIKFRAWQDGQMLTMPISGVYATKRFFGLLYEDTELMQFTGLFDKNGKEIYEGDILATSNTNPEYDIWDKEENGFTVVEWSTEDAMFQGSRWRWDGILDGGDESIYCLSKFVEVIGNIHENPELLEKRP